MKIKKLQKILSRNNMNCNRLKYNFTFLSDYKILSRNTQLYPITLTDVKQAGIVNSISPSETTYDSFITNNIIPEVIQNWERDTGYYIQDTTIKSFYQLEHVLLPFNLNILNVVSITNIKYYPYNWNGTDAKTTIATTDYYTIEESLQKPLQIIFKDTFNNHIYPSERNVEIEFKAGFTYNITTPANTFINLPQDIKQALIYEAGRAFDASRNHCNETFKDIINKTYAKYKIARPSISII